MRKIANLLQQFASTGQKGVAWLIDPDKNQDFSALDGISSEDLDLILVGGSRVERIDFEHCIQQVKLRSREIPVCIFPSSPSHVSALADGILFLSLISGDNPDFLITYQRQAASKIQQTNLEVLPTGYILVNSGELLSVHRESKTLPILNSEVKSVVETALAGKYLGMDFIYLDAGSGANFPVDLEVIRTVKKTVQLPLLVGGGHKDSHSVRSTWEAGADLVVLGNSIENDPGFLAEVLHFKTILNLSLNVN